MESEKLRVLQDNFYIYFSLEPMKEVYIEIFDLDKYGMPKISDEPRIYKGVTLREAVDKAYRAEFKTNLVGGVWKTLMIRCRNLFNLG